MVLSVSAAWLSMTPALAAFGERGCLPGRLPLSLLERFRRLLALVFERLP